MLTMHFYIAFLRRKSTCINHKATLILRILIMYASYINPSMDSNKFWFTGQLLQFGFIASTTDSSLFIYRTKTTIAYLLLYVDDIVLKSNIPSFLNQLIQHLSSVFELKDLGPLHYFLGIQVTRDSTGLNLSRAKYATALLHKHNMSHTKPISTPCTPNTRLSLSMMVLNFLILIVTQIST